MLIACEAYENCNNLIGLDKDVERLEEVLVKNCSCSDESVYKCTCDEKSKYQPENSANIQLMIEKIRKSSENSGERFDIGFFYYGGHGINRNGKPSAVLQNYNKNYGLDDPSSTLALETLIGYLRNFQNVTNWIVFLDMCHSEGENPSGINSVPSFKNVVYISSCQSGEAAYMRRDEKGSVFAHCLVDALSRGSSCITIDDVYEKIRSTITNISNKEGRQPQHPEMHLTDVASELRKIQVTNNILGNNAYYEKYFNDVLFLEYRYNSKIQARLCDVYVEPVFKWCSDCNNINYDARLTFDERINYDSLINWCLYDDDNENFGNSVILFGKAGVGKTSLVCDIVKRFNESSMKCRRRIVTIKLREYAEIFLSYHCTAGHIYSYHSSHKLINNILNNKLIKFKDYLIILDGMDEISVLVPEFDIKKFLSNLVCDANKYNVKFLITSRESYFDCSDIRLLTKLALIWDDFCIEKWCEQYQKAQPRRTCWCNVFPEKYSKFDDVKVKSIISCPIILYMMCVSELELDDNINRARIYDEAFSNVGKRTYSKLEKLFPDEETYEKYRKIIKEISFITSYTGNNSSLDVCRNVIIEACEKSGINESDFQREKAKFFGMFYFASSSSKSNYAFQVAHRTVFEYFTALKVCEDFLKINEPNLINIDNEKDLWNALFRAFRYGVLEDSIFEFITDILRNKCKYDDYRECLGKLFCNSVSKEYFINFLTDEPEYKTKLLKNVQFDVAFANTFSFLDFLDFYNWTKERVESDEKDILSKNIEYLKYLFKHFSRYNSIKIRPKTLYLEGVDFGSGDICGANLSGLKLAKANLSELKMNSVNLNYTSLIGASLPPFIMDSFFMDSCLAKLNVEKIEFYGCNLFNAHIDEEDLIKCKFILCRLNQTNISREQEYDFNDLIAKNEDYHFSI